MCSKCYWGCHSKEKDLPHLTVDLLLCLNRWKYFAACHQQCWCSKCYWGWHPLTCQFPWGQLLSVAQISQFLRDQLLRTALRFVNFHGMAPHWFINFHGVSYWVALTNSSIQDGTHWFVNFHGVSYWAWHSLIHQFPWGQLLRMALTDLKWHSLTHLLRMALTDLSISMGWTIATGSGTHWFVNFHGVNYWDWHSLICQFPWGQRQPNWLQFSLCPSAHPMKTSCQLWSWAGRSCTSFHQKHHLTEEENKFHTQHITHDLLPASQEWLENERRLFSTAYLSEPF